jgi:hypothetical protein
MYAVREPLREKTYDLALRIFSRGRIRMQRLLRTKAKGPVFNVALLKTTFVGSLLHAYQGEASVLTL